MSFGVWGLQSAVEQMEAWGISREALAFFGAYITLLGQGFRHRAKSKDEIGKATERIAALESTVTSHVSITPQTESIITRINRSADETRREFRDQHEDLCNRMQGMLTRVETDYRDLDGRVRVVEQAQAVNDQGRP
jgi:hypothetical protein